MRRTFELRAVLVNSEGAAASHSNNARGGRLFGFAFARRAAAALGEGTQLVFAPGDAPARRGSGWLQVRPR